MLDVHPVHEAVFTWKGFLFHIATIVVGLFIAVGLEQAVEYVHHHHQREQLEEQMRLVFSGDIDSDAQDLKRIAELRADLTSLRNDIDGRLHGKRNNAGLTPPANRITMVALVVPSMAPYEAAKENGTVGLLPVERIRMYSHLYFEREVLLGAFREWRSATTALADFTERFTDYPDDAQLGGSLVLPDMGALKPTDLDEYLRLVATLIKRSDMAASFVNLYSGSCQAILDGVSDDATLLERGVHQRGQKATPAGAPRQTDH